jgi:PRTRC genetic system protein C
MLTTIHLERVFVFDNKGHEIRLSDPMPTHSPEQVMNFYSSTYPILTTSTIEGPEIRDDQMRYTFKTTLGTKG